MGVLQFQTRKQSLIEQLCELNFKGMVSLVTVTEIKALKKSRITKNPTPSNLEIITKYSYKIVSLGNEYEVAVNNRLKKEGKEQDFESTGSYCEPVSDNNILFKHKAKEQFYLRYYSNLCPTHKTVTIYCDACGVEIPRELFYELQKEYYPIPNSKNESQGLDNDIQVNNVKLENIKWIKHGDFTFNDLTHDILGKIQKVEKENTTQREIKKAA